MPSTSRSQRPQKLAAWAATQSQAVSRRQLHACGFDRHATHRRISNGLWQAAGRAVILHNGPITAHSLQWAAVLSVHGPAAIGGRTAATTYRLRGFEADEVDVVVTASEKVPAMDGVHWHHSRRFIAADIAPGPRLPAVRPARAVVDAATWTPKPRVACALLIAAVQQGVTTAPALRSELKTAASVRHRRHLIAVLADIEGGADSLSEIDFTKLARRAGLPPPLRQSVRLDGSGRRRYLDVDFGAFAVEVDGGVHLRSQNSWDDARRQNDLVIGGDRILRFPSVAIRLDEAAVIDQLRRAWAVFGPAS